MEHALILGLDAPRLGPPYVWSDQYEWKLQLVGTVGEDTAVEEGSAADGRFVVSYRTDGRLVGALLVNFASRLARWRAQVLAACPGSPGAPTVGAGATGRTA